MRSWGLLILALMTPQEGWATLYAAASCGSAHIQSAIDGAADGDTVVVPAGSCTWSTTVSIPNTKGITLEGAGIGQTIITDNVPGADTLYVVTATGNAVTRITGFTFIPIAKTLTGSAQVAICKNAQRTCTGLNSFRIDHISIDGLTGNGSRGVSVRQSGAEMSGLIDHITLSNAAASGTVQGIAIYGSGPGEGTPFSRPLSLGTNQAVYVEDSTFNFETTTADGALDAYFGVRYVWRYNTVNGTIFGHHGADSGNGRAPAGYEHYRNTSTTGNHGVSRGIGTRGGVGAIFDNSFTTQSPGTYSTIIDTMYYRSTQSFAPYGQCDGTSPYDENQSGQTGYACLDQEGHFFTDDPVGDSGSNTLYGTYVWGNTHGVAQANMTADDLDQWEPTLRDVHIHENRDFYNQNASFTGATGIGVGTLAARPATCTTGVGYWATDQGTWNQLGADGVLYKCTSTDTWEVYYTPYTYPHPLQNYTAGSEVSQVTGVRLHGPTSVARPTLSWLLDASANATSYQIYASTSPGGMRTLLATVTAALAEARRSPLTRFIPTFLASGTYYLTVTVMDVLREESAVSSEVSVTSPGLQTRAVRN